jgi:UDP-N-acetylmuramoyl-L-alanyl-D-glutamate--2,6-diaminopimelate ligase
LRTCCAPRALPGDTVVVAGKGHEPYQIVGNERFAFDDRDEVRAALALRGEAARA